MARSVVVAALFSFATGCLGPNPLAANGAMGEDDDGDLDEDQAQDGARECADDVFEPNDEPQDARVIVWDQISASTSRVRVDGFLCPGEHDWYRIPIDELDLDSHVLRVDGLVMGTSWCAQVQACGGPALSEAPEHTLAVEIYDADSMVLLSAAIATDGRVDIDASGPSFGRDLRIHVFGPSAAATWSYELHVDVRSGPGDHDGDAECEC